MAHSVHTVALDVCTWWRSPTLLTQTLSISCSASLTQHLTCIISVIFLLLEYSAMNSVYKMLSSFGRHSVVLKKLLGMFSYFTRCIRLITHWKRTNMKPAVAFLYCICLNSYVWQSWLKDVYIYIFFMSVEFSLYYWC